MQECDALREADRAMDAYRLMVQQESTLEETAELLWRLARQVPAPPLAGDPVVRLCRRWAG